MERVGKAVGRELGRFGPADGMAPVVDAWPAAVGEDIARNAWPARLARDGTLHINTTDSIWAFELKSRVQEIRERLGAAAPPRLAFAPGPIPEPPVSPSAAGEKTPPQPRPEHVAEADSLARVIRDEELRKVVAKAAALSLAKAADDRSFW
jgi:Dna[CI] antecedent, DciA